MNIVVYFVEFVRYVIPSMTVAGILTSVDSVNDVFDLVRKWESFWTIFFPILWKFIYYFEQAFICAHQWVHVLLSYERFVFFCQPFHARRKCSKKRMRWGVVFILVASLIYSIPYALEYEITFWDGDTPTTFSSLLGGDKGFVRMIRV